jgi:threonylcarbamoyladenosine tRNA methylthiotransferase MtaB
MPTAAFTTLGCKVNQYETQRILDSFEEAGFAIVPFDSTADVYVINTCSVTSIAEGKSRYTVRRANRNNPNAKVIATGCAAQFSVNKKETFEGVDVLVPNPDKLNAIQYLYKQFPEIEKWVESEPAPKSSGILQGRTRYTLKIQDGCSVYCSYCSIPYTRPGMHSRPYQEVLTEAKRAAKFGHKELILTGVLIGNYGPETGSDGPNFEDLLEMLSEVEGIDRIRISSIEIRDVSQRLIDLISEGKKIVPHLHVPLQCGDTQVLADMNRPYTQDDYLELCQRLYKQIPDFSLTTDIMVGFPTETEERFLSSVKVCEEAKYLKAHLFRFSPRHGTPADQWGDPVSPQEKQRRSKVLSEVTKQTALEHTKKFLGRTLRVLVEGKPNRDGLLVGLSDNYLEVQFAGPKSLLRHFAWIRLDQLKDGALFGELVDGPTDDVKNSKLHQLKLI